jgi:hypothetical protein
MKRSALNLPPLNQPHSLPISAYWTRVREAWPQMKYVVSYAMAGVPKGPVAIDDNLSLEEALSLAGELIAEGSRDVFIGDRDDNQIGGEELTACCRGEKKLMPDLRAVLRLAPVK